LIKSIGQGGAEGHCSFIDLAWHVYCASTG
jgi:hypothetical protein